MVGSPTVPFGKTFDNVVDVKSIVKLMSGCVCQVFQFCHVYVFWGIEICGDGGSKWTGELEYSKDGEEGIELR